MKNITYKLLSVEGSLISHGEFDDENPKAAARELLAYAYRLNESYDQEIILEPVDETLFKVKTGGKDYVLEFQYNL